MKTEELLLNLSHCPAPSGFEDAMVVLLKSYLKQFCDKVWSDKSKSVIGYISCGKKNAKKLMIDAHLDQVGLIVSKINEDGSIEFKNLGGIDLRILPMTDVIILGDTQISGIICSKNGKFLIDTGYVFEDISKIVKIGTPILPKSNFNMLLNRTVSGSAMDNRAGIASVLLALNQLKNADISYDLYILFSSQEELGLRGARKSGYDIKPDAALCIDVTFGKTPDTNDDTGVFKLGCGSVICRGPNLDNRITKGIINIAKTNNLPFEIEVASSSSGTNAWAIQVSGNGVPSALISIPIRYMHTYVETLDLDDIETVSKMIALSIKGGVF